MEKKLLILFCGLLFISPLKAQTDIENLFRAKGEIAARDAKKLLKGYFNPLVKGFGYGMANGWYNTAKTHEPLGFDVTVTINAAMIPDEDLFYDIAALELERIELVSVNGNVSGQAPTLFGPDVPVQYRFTDPDLGSQTFQGPPGVGLKEEIGSNFAPVPMAQIGIGTIKNTDVKIRFVPEVGGKDYSFQMWGIGIMHDITQYIGLESAPIDISAFVGYTDLHFELDLSDPNNAVTAGQRGTFDSNTLTFQALVSKKLSLLTIYGGIGYNRISSKFNMLGIFNIDTDGNGDADFTLTDPVKNMDFPSGGARATAGAQLKLAAITLHADYTLQEYNTLTVGLGVSLR
ncbi:MAG: DUF6588 family protein [Candidatus Cyclobacteriaceae bacterium M2_1C_046]